MFFIKTCKPTKEIDMQCFYCTNYESHHGPTKSSYCRGFGAYFGDDENNPSGSEQFKSYYNMGGNATNSCPHGRHSPDYD